VDTCRFLKYDLVHVFGNVIFLQVSLVVYKGLFVASVHLGLVVMDVDGRGFALIGHLRSSLSLVSRHRRFLLLLESIRLKFMLFLLSLLRRYNVKDRFILYVKRMTVLFVANIGYGGVFIVQ
jgi:hypothetical protein